MANEFDLSGYVTRTTDGSVDIQQSHAKFTGDLNRLIQMERADSEVIARAVEKVWQDHTEQKVLPMGALIHYAMENLQTSPENFNDLQERVANFVRSKPGIYKIGKGKGGGVSRVGVEAGGQPSVPPGGSVRPKSSSQATG